MTRLPIPAWIAMMPMLCATMSCSSRAIRSRSAVAACASACARSASAWTCACRIELPTSQAMTTIVGTIDQPHRNAGAGHARVKTDPRSLNPADGQHTEDHGGGGRREPARAGCCEPADFEPDNTGEYHQHDRAPLAGRQYHRGKRAGEHNGQGPARPAAQ